MVMKYGEKAGKIWINGSNEMEISKSDIFLGHPLLSFCECEFACTINTNASLNTIYSYLKLQWINMVTDI